MRLFVAINLPDPVRSWALDRIEELKTDFSGSPKWVKPESLHLTLAFLGEVQESRVPGLGAALVRAAAGMSGFELGLDGFGAFPSSQRAKVLWFGVAGGLDPLRALQAIVAQETKSYCAKPENRSYSPHLTVARVPEAIRVPTEVGSRVMLSPTWTVESFSLMQSQPKPTGAVYTELQSFPLERGIGPRNA